MYILVVFAATFARLIVKQYKLGYSVSEARSFLKKLSLPFVALAPFAEAATEAEAKEGPRSSTDRTAPS